MEALDKITYKIIGCAMEVHNELGNGFQEVVYQRCLAIEMENKGLSFLREQEMPLYYKGNEVGTRRADFIVEGQILVELKAVIQPAYTAPIPSSCWNGAKGPAFAWGRSGREIGVGRQTVAYAQIGSARPPRPPPRVESRLPATNQLQLAEQGGELVPSLLKHKVPRFFDDSPRFGGSRLAGEVAQQPIAKAL